ncbi:MAG: SDR family oxidoreductase [Actinomycetes bacterium]
MALTSASSENTVVVTGASSGIGTEIANVLASRGHGLTLVARRADRLEQLAGDINHRFGVEAMTIPCDLADRSARAALADRLESGKPVSGLVNNAGFGKFGDLKENDPDREREMVELNITAVHDLTVRLLPGMVARGSGAILNTGSTAGFQPLPGVATYGATKAFVISFSEALSSELSGTGVSCTVLCPGPVKTEFSEVAGGNGMEDRLPDFTIVSAEDVARQAVDGMERGARIVIPGFANRISAVGGRISPRALVLPLTRKMMG